MVSNSRVPTSALIFVRIFLRFTSSFPKSNFLSMFDVVGLVVGFVVVRLDVFEVVIVGLVAGVAVVGVIIVRLADVGLVVVLLIDIGPFVVGPVLVGPVDGGLVLVGLEGLILVALDVMLRSNFLSMFEPPKSSLVC